MYVAHLSLVDFRSYPQVELPLDPGVTTFVGPNGQGKTNLVEAIGYLATLGSHRVAQDAPLVRVDAERAIVRASISATDQTARPSLVEVEITPGKANRARLNRSPVNRAREILGVVRTVLFAPEDLSLVKGDPGERRRYLDELLVARAPRYAGVRSDYERVLKQRNALLKSAGTAARSTRGSGGPDLQTLDIWDAHLARAGAELLAARLELVDAIRPLVAKAYQSVAGSEASPAPADARLDYKSSMGPDVTLTPDREHLADALTQAMSELRRDEIDRGVSLVGPHRDDLVLSLGPLPARGYASQGESWSLALALRLASFDLLRSLGSDPVLVLDDVFAELDTSRRERLAELVGTAEQVLVTAAVADDVPERLDGARIDVLGNDLRRVA
ncbi:DNA replication/repair protein RecF [Actinobacteria bacterium YIM 96077]|uniref:DNA replication and repair protein RecF n=1 Tax=Phytoactinopolyspora halophila TaxID=1981511 RepID=A0A329QRC8_9ACTN|nr:DNA replication/repair protein RecF [Phytoactinopolyspora halophila]AYY11345.1 DNA replication/repair protein RecF [Actinobacteria bacterium YIM 96077]RAW14706.1 DNA replication/repair protein RecF [Phytoactinopolyspora halophila]